MDTAIQIIAIVLIVAGIFFFLGGTVGIIRFPDFYTRMHAAGKGDTLSTLLMIGGFALYHLPHVFAEFEKEGGGHWEVPALVIVKMIGICVFIMVTSPTSTHALIEAGYADGIKPEVNRDDLKGFRQQQAKENKQS